jgi:hypothetical protein
VPVKTTAWTVRVAVGPVDECVELLGDVVAEQAQRTAVDARDKHRSAVLDLEVASYFFCHDRSPMRGCDGRGAPLAPLR